MFTRPIIQMMLIFIAVTSALPANDDASNKRHGSGKSKGKKGQHTYHEDACKSKAAGDPCTFQGKSGTINDNDGRRLQRVCHRCRNGRHRSRTSTCHCGWC